MLQYFYLIFLLSCSLILEVLFRSVGLYIPLAAFAVFYTACLCGLVPGVLFGFAAGFLIDSLLGYPAPYSMLFYPLLLPMVWLLKEEQLNANSLLFQMGFGSLTVILVQLPVVPWRNGWQVTLELLPAFFLASLFAAMLLPFFISIADRFSDAMCLRTYTRSFSTGKERD